MNEHTRWFQRMRPDERDDAAEGWGAACFRRYLLRFERWYPIAFARTRFRGEMQAFERQQTLDFRERRLPKQRETVGR